MLTLTETAAEVVRTLVEQSEAPDSGGLRIAAADSTIEGVELELSLVGEPEALDDKLLDAQVADDHVTFVLREEGDWVEGSPPPTP